MLVVEAEGLHKRFGEVEALRGVDLQVSEGEILGLLGPNGAGKTTTINVLTTLIRPDAGTARVDGIDVIADPAAARGRIGLTGQFAALDDGLTARENLVLFGRLLKLGSAGAWARADELLTEFGLAEVAHRRTGTFSGGMRRRLDLAASMIGRPRVLFLDEPTTGLDPHSRNALWEAVRSLRAEGTTIVLTTQYLAEADELADRIVVIDHGKVIADGTAHELKQRTGGSTCQVGVAESTVDRAQRVLAERWEVSRDELLLTIPAAGPQTLVEVLRLLDEHDVAPTEVGLRQPTLDDVFLALTGRASNPATPATETPAGATAP
ncbi:daunorubicin/doxorubicin resistance ABC transporter ATP-binding protein DrrA [Aeromicrobium sp. PE09-221]|uniref:ATP-binding cassette domain-containing protein n=1 Tax=Aeromicrobium sp. PE09-221 TaxID=1898043 RepID=UPI000B3E4FA0|nr:ATP-binding cassette domain-containing protein [Aeromicrobium sp. PE09-221]OUZ10324.1 daunorubicin/doxorubicin resistance ABC transporter ATP-binding protein DrrA [Aeromicrobium sp. PE09-221]